MCTDLSTLCFIVCTLVCIISGLGYGNEGVSAAYEYEHVTIGTKKVWYKVCLATVVCSSVDTYFSLSLCVHTPFETLRLCSVLTLPLARACTVCLSRGYGHTHTHTHTHTPSTLLCKTIIDQCVCCRKPTRRLSWTNKDDQLSFSRSRETNPGVLSRTLVVEKRS